ncbi:hypothetical protein FML41_22155 [Klebsiella michiganensis]|nr:hypothetical protein [Klebsiella michiganensis]MBZ7750760.1 hypothetical protein [Klebsiella michiganensis]RMC81965.1 hypothetical protein EBH72_24795 [Klebsiella michiganensis]TYE54804.1 hypothetical protein DJ508_19180 [Klebsiella michiganensis]
MLLPLAMIIGDFPSYLTRVLIQPGIINIQYWLKLHKRHQEASADNSHSHPPEYRSAIMIPSRRPDCDKW